MSQHHQASAWKVSIKDIAHKPGTTKKMSTVLTAPSDLAIPMIRVPEGSDVELDLNLEAVHEGIFATGSVTATAEGECSRCLDPLVYDLDINLSEMFFFEDAVDSRDVQEDDGEDELRLVDRDYVDLEPAVRDNIVTALPFQPVCREDCEGLCSECGVRLADHPGHHHEVLDPRWAALNALAQEQEK